MPGPVVPGSASVRFADCAGVDAGMLLSQALGRLAGVADGFDAGEALGGGLGDRRQAWDFIRRFAAEWTTPLGPGDGVSRDAWRAAEHHVGVELPAALREAYLLFGRRPDLTSRQDRLIPPHRLGLDEPGSAVVFRVENQGCAEWGVAVADLASADPPVCIRDRDGGDWEPFLDRVSVACAEMVLSEVVTGRGRLGDMCDLPRALDPPSAAGPKSRLTSAAPAISGCRHPRTGILRAIHWPAGPCYGRS